MTTLKWLSIVLICGFLGVFAHAQAQKARAPLFSLNLLGGGQFDSSSLEGKVAVLKFVASY